MRDLAAQIVGLALHDILAPRPETRFRAGRSTPKPRKATKDRAAIKAARKQKHRK